MRYIICLTSFQTAKAYMNYLSKVMAAEYADQGIVVQTVIPNQVVTNLSRQFCLPGVAVSVDVYVRYALKTVGTESMTSAHPRHKFLNNIVILVKNNICEEWLFKKMLGVMRTKSNQLKEMYKKQ